MRQIGTCTMLMLALCIAGCDAGSSPVAPAGTVLSITANPTSIETDGSATITVTARDPSGAPILSGTEIRFSTDLGTIEEVVTTDATGRARATLRGDGRAGTATVIATSGVASGAPQSAQVSINVGGVEPVAGFSFTIDALTVIFEDASTGSPTSWSWRFGDGRTSSRRNPVHTYTAGGTYTVSLTVTNPEGESTTSQFVTVAAVAPKASFEVASRNGLQVRFRDTSTGGPTSWSWDFGGDGTSSLRNPTHTFSAEGVYSVALTASNNGGSDTFRLEVTVP